MTAHSDDEEKSELIVCDDLDGSWRLAWYFKRDGDIGGHVGETDEGESEPEERDEWECWKASRIAKTFGPERDRNGFYWPTKRGAAAALAAIKVAFTASEGRPMPDWATTALGAGWKPPKGWKP